MGSGMYPAGAYVTFEHENILVFYDHQPTYNPQMWVKQDAEKIGRIRKNSDYKNTNSEEIKDLQSNVEPITRKEIVEIVEDILSKKEPYIPTSNETEVLETDVTETILPSRTVYVAKNQHSVFFL